MNIYITLDYELFFGENSGSIEDCIIGPTRAILDILEPHNIKLTCFVDVGYLFALERQKGFFPKLEKDYALITNQIKYLSENGHGVELHVHPHWEDSFYSDDTGWKMNTSRYKITDFSDEDAISIFKKYNDILTKISGKPAVAYRAGGWSAQPFSKVKKALESCNIFIDSTVYPNGHYNSHHQFFDFRKVDQYKTQYHFSNDLTVEDREGRFTEIPISSYKVNPTFFWKFAFHKIFKQKKHSQYGNGSAISMNKSGIFQLMTQPSYSVVSIDGYKSSYLVNAFKRYLSNTNNKGNFVILGHPKAFTPYSLNQLKKFISENRKEQNYVTY